MKARIVYLKERARQLGEKELQAALACEDNHPMWVAINQVLDAFAANAVLDVSEPKQASDERAHAAGQIDVVVRLKQRLQELHGAAGRGRMTDDGRG